MKWLAVLPVLTLLGSSCSTTGVHQLKNGQLRVQCPSEQSECFRQAEAHCEDRGGVHVVSSREKDELYGTEAHQEGLLMSEIIFVCGDDAPREPLKLPPRAKRDEEAPAAPTKRLCIPGSTQRCVGPGACVGGQSCAADGTAWSACDCAPPPTPATSAGDAAASAADAGPGDAGGAAPPTGTGAGDAGATESRAPGAPR